MRRSAHTLLRSDHDDVAIAVLPAGAGNLFAENLDIPLDVRGAVTVALHSEVECIDAGVVNDDQHFLVMAGTGIDARMVKDADDSDAKDRFGRLGYGCAAVHLRNVSAAHAEVAIDREPWLREPWLTSDASSVIAGNVGKLLAGIPAFPAPSPTDGLPDLSIVGARRASDWARLFRSVVTHRVASSPFSKVTRARKLPVDLDRTFPWEAGGGERDRTDRFEIRCVPHAVSICRPHRSAEEVAS